MNNNEIVIVDEDLNINNLRSGFFKKENNKCNTCIHKNNGVSGSSHVGCSNKFAIVDISNHGIRNGWAFYPIDFDPIWIESCDSYMNKDDKIELAKLTSLELKKKSICEVYYLRLKFIHLKDKFGVSKDLVDRVEKYGKLAKALNDLDSVSNEELINTIHELKMI